MLYFHSILSIYGVITKGPRQSHTRRGNLVALVLKLIENN